MNYYKRNIFLPLLLLLFALGTKAQENTGSTTVENSTVNIAAGTTEMRFSQGTYFGPDADWTIDGVLEIWSENIWIAPGATFNGSGRIVIHNPSTSPYYENTTSGATYIDGNNGEFIHLLVEHRNDENVILLDINDPGYGTSNPTGPEAAQLNIGASLDLAVNGANIILNGNNLAFNDIGTIDNFSSNRMVVTSNSVDGHMIKEYGQGGSFTFPVGIEEKDYTPARLTALEGGRLYVSVQDYRGSLARVKDEQLGMDRSWHIYSPDALKADLMLYHNANTQGSQFVDDQASIVQYASATDWDLLETDLLSSSVHRSFNAVMVANMIESGIWFTKLTEPIEDFFLPNVFTPNGDGSNDVFEIKGLERYDHAEMVVFNRWGNEVYRNPNYQNNWDGQGLNEGTYYYFITMVKDGKESVFKGWVLLKR